MASTLLAVDDSVTMRKVLEITFAGPDFRVVTANSPDAALQKLKADKIDLVITDLSLEPMNGYDLCKAIDKASPATPVIVLSSKQNAFDAAKGSSAQADDHMDKPFDTQQMIDKVRSCSPGRVPVPALPAVGGAAKPVAAAGCAQPRRMPAQQPAVAARPVVAAGLPPPRLPRRRAARPAPRRSVPRRSSTTRRPAVAAPSRRPPRPRPCGADARLRASRPRSRPPPSLRSQPRVPVAADQPRAPADGVHHAATPAPVPAAAAHVNGQMASKLEQIGLTPAQVDAVLALSREVVERVVWEVVPVLAETPDQGRALPPDQVTAPDGAPRRGLRGVDGGSAGRPSRGWCSSGWRWPRSGARCATPSWGAPWASWPRLARPRCWWPCPGCSP